MVRVATEPHRHTKLIILDRDGVINYDSEQFIKTPDEWRPIPGSLEAIARLSHAGFRVVVATNQSGIGRGLYDAAAYHAVQQRLTELLAAHGAHVDAAYFCPHYPDTDGPCDCRKPGVKLFRDAQDVLGIDLRRSYWVGDRLSDVEPARALGADTTRGILVATGHGGRHRAQAEALGIPVVPDLAAAVEQIVQGK